MESSVASAYYPQCERSELRSSFFLLFFLLIEFFLLTVFGKNILVSFGITFLLPILLLAVLSFKITSAILVILLFIPLGISYFPISLVFAPCLLLSVSINKVIKADDLKLPILTPLLIFITSVLPSFYNSSKIEYSILKFYNIVAFIIVIYAISLYITNYKHIRHLWFVYLFMVIINSLDLIVYALNTGRRYFGFAGIEFVDYSALTFVVVSVMLFFQKMNKRRFQYVFPLMIIGSALLLTQTRNTWLSALITLIIVIGLVIIRPELVFLSRRRVVFRILTMILFIGICVTLVLYVNPKVETRVTSIIDKKAAQFDEWGNTQNSLITRALIWSVAYNAFMEHPIIGIGLYSFPHTSSEYSNLPKFLYKKYVEGLSPHQTHVALLTETGIVGFIGFMILIVSIVRIAYKNMQNARDPESRFFSIMSMTALIYAIVSMFFTDAWLWGNCMGLFAIIVGTVLSNKKIIDTNEK